MKLAVTGKGGVGKTTISALLSAALEAAGGDVLAIDADPDANLLACMGYAEPDKVPPLVELKDLIEERTGAKPGTTGGMFKMNPRVEDIPGKYAVDIDGVKVLVAGAVKRGGTGCYCPENAFVRTLISHLLLKKNMTLIVDMEAGVEHLSRGTAEAVDALLIVVEPGRRSLETAGRITRMAADLRLQRVTAVGSKIRSETEKAFLEKTLSDIEFVGFVPYDERLRDAEIGGRSVVGASEQVGKAISEMMTNLLGLRHAAGPRD